MTALQTLRDALRPRGRLLTVFNVVTGLIMAVGAVLLYQRFRYGLGAITNLTQDVPWGLWIGFDVVTGVAFAGGAYVLTFMVYVLRMESYRPIVRVTVLNGFLAYVFYAGALLLDLGRPWNVVNPIIGNGFGVSSVLFLVAWHFLLYMMATLLEFSPAIVEWLGLERTRKVLGGLTLGAVIFGVTLSTLHQSGLGALYMMAKPKIHPLWYSDFIPVLFFVSSIFAGLSMVIFEGSITHKVFQHRVGKDLHASESRILVGLSRVCAGAMFVYLFLVSLALVHEGSWRHAGEPMFAWWLIEVVGFVLVPMGLFLRGGLHRSMRLIRIAAAAALVGVLLNRLNLTVIGFRWDAAVRYVPTWQEIVVTLAVISAELWVFRWVVNRLPVLAPLHEETPSRGAVPTPAE